MKKLLKDVLIVFFLSAHIHIDFEWNVNTRKMEDDLGNTTTTERNGVEFQHVRMHPTRRSQPGIQLERIGSSLAQNRLGTTLHELIHAYLGQFGCEECRTYKENMSDHGRAFQILAKAIEEQSLRLLGLELNLGRLDGMVADMKNGEGRNVPSVHDSEVYGFLERLGTIPR
ncbi:hypothetical protein EJ02DRAFT_49275 [Clathrospora elynae]|uniref:SprT-like domain-containing protein n=1 Tax=Clathrospora elynae TaxID=706981 RepID=A0A6A5SCH6_9PLEO|nr:hypothetical protein EJ02DRAFT_49275 [Clathrospora elynae]